jgi:hypothetical protein
MSGLVFALLGAVWMIGQVVSGIIRLLADLLSVPVI